MILTPISVRGHSGGVTVTVLKYPDSNISLAAGRDRRRSSATTTSPTAALAARTSASMPRWWSSAFTGCCGEPADSGFSPPHHPPPASSLSGLACCRRYPLAGVRRTRPDQKTRVIPANSFKTSETRGSASPPRPRPVLGAPNPNPAELASATRKSLTGTRGTRRRERARPWPTAPSSRRWSSRRTLAASWTS